jgi:hypothetical protein
MHDLLTCPQLSAAGLALFLAGCAGLGRPGADTATLPGWSAELAALLPAIKACVGEVEGTASGITRAWTMANSLAGVRVLREDGTRLDCVASDAGDRVVMVQPVWRGSRLRGEAAPLYTPGDRRPPEGPCVQTVPAVVSNERVGWLSYGACKPETAKTHPIPPPGPFSPSV